jgi:putative ABC transport system permease protein
MNQAPGAPNHPAAVTLRIYRALASAFPQEFKNVYGDEMLQVAEDAIEGVWRRHGLAGLARLLLDIAIRVPAEYLTELRQDIRHGLRMLGGSPGFTAVALISLSLGIGIAASAYSEVNGLLRDLPGVPNPDQLAALQTPVSYPTYKRYRELNDLFSGAFAYVAPVPFGIWLNGRTERTWGHVVTASYFSTLGVHPLLGRFFDDADERPGQAPAVVVGYRFWEDRLGSDASVVGKTIRINGQP